MATSDITYTKEYLEEAYFGPVMKRWAEIVKCEEAQEVTEESTEVSAQDVSVEDEQPISDVALTAPLPKPLDQPVFPPIQIVIPDNVLVIPKTPQTESQLKKAAIRSRAVRVKSVLVYVLTLVAVILIVNVVVQVINNPDMSLSDWVNVLKSYFETV